MTSWLLLASAVLLLTLVSGLQDIREPPRITKPDRPLKVYALLGDRVELQCQALGDPAPTYTWWKNGLPLPSSAEVQIDQTAGTLTIMSLTTVHEADYTCLATNEFPGTPPLRPTSLAPVITVILQRIGGALAKGVTVNGTEFQYLSLQCRFEEAAVGPHVFYKWYQGTDTTLPLDMDGDRLYIDTEGTLHFTYLKQTDSKELPRAYFCFQEVLPLMKQASNTSLTVRPATVSSAIAPRLRFSNSGVKVALYQTAKLECVFEGYDPNPNMPDLPQITWKDTSLKEIVNNGKYQLSDDSRRLEILNVQEADEGDYSCQASNSAQTTANTFVTLDVTSTPVWNPDGMPSYLTVPDGEDAIFRCDARSLVDETPPRTPDWFINGQPFVPGTDPSKFVMSSDKKQLTIRSVQKATDIFCVQCRVSNHVGNTWGDGCLNVILPITITYQPKAIQDINKGDAVDLTVRATTDASISRLVYIWTFNNVTYTDTPPFAQVDPVQNRMFINTSALSPDEFKSVAGVYTCRIYHNYQSVTVETEVFIEPGGAPVAGGAFELWMIGLIVGILLLLLLFIVCCIVICRKKQEGDYNVDKKEVAAGYHPKKELDENRFDAYAPEEDKYDGKMPETSPTIFTVENPVPNGKNGHIPAPYTNGGPPSPYVNVPPHSPYTNGGPPSPYMNSPTAPPYTNEDVPAISFTPGDRWGSETHSLDSYQGEEQPAPYINENGSLVLSYPEPAQLADRDHNDGPRDYQRDPAYTNTTPPSSRRSVTPDPQPPTSPRRGVTWEEIPIEGSEMSEDPEAPQRSGSGRRFGLRDVMPGETMI
ncbi:neural cell adhesion molecule L1 [Aplysia californica]|uniref:Neural cell adhesion molecule L1 n=1 Tax=Aplysia californica TaxID=6500 RepID=A0ABM1A5F1_APLCA|nr:neural cell adhesion molecule L1 [Aplysia californica]